MSLNINAGTTNVSVELQILDSGTWLPRTDFVYNSAGIDLNYRRDGATVTTITEATLGALTTAHTDGGFLHVANGRYRLDLPDAACATGVDQVTVGGTVTGGVVIPRSIQLNVQEANIVKVSGDTTAAGNLKLQYDTTGLTGGTFPSTQDAVGGIGTTGGAALPVEATSDNAGGAIIDSVTILGTEAGTYANTEADDAAYHVITGTATALDWVYGFVLGGGYVASALEWKGFVNSNNDSITVQAWNGSTWDTRKVIQGVPGSTDQLETIGLLAKHTTTAGLVYLRFVTSGNTNPELHTDLLSVLKVNTSRTVGYNQGVSVDTLTGIAGTEAWYNGTGDNPSLTWADAQTIGASVGLSHYHVSNGSTIVLDQATDNVEIKGDEFTVDFNGQSINNSSVSHGLVYTGTFSGYPHLLHAGINAITGPGAKIGWGAIRGPIVSTDGGTSNRWVLHDCWGVDETTGEFDFGAAVATAQVVYITAYDGPLKISNINTAGDKLYLSGNGSLVIDASCTNGTIYISGQWKITNSGSSAIVYDDITTDTDAILVDTGTTIPASISALNNVSVVDVLTTQMTEAYAADGVAPTLAQSLFLIQQSLGDFSITGGTLTVKQLDGSATAATFTLSPSGNPTSTTRAS